MVDCPLCNNADHVYDHWKDVMYGTVVLCSVHGIQTLPDPKVLHDLEEEWDPALPYIDGSNLDGASIEVDDIKDHADHMGCKPV